MAATTTTAKTLCLYTNFVSRQVVALDALIFGEETPLEVWNTKPGITVFTIDEEDCHTLAYLAVYKADGNTWHIWKTGVHPDHTEKGFFKRMLNYVFNRAREHDKNITIGTDPARFPVMHSILERHTCERFDRPVEAGKQKKEGYVYYKWERGTY